MAIAPYFEGFEATANLYVIDESPMYVAIGAQNPFAAKAALSPDDIFSCRWLIFSDSGNEKQQLPHNLEPFRKRLGEYRIYNDRLRLHNHLREGQGISPTPENAISPDEKGIIFRPFPIKMQPARLYLYVAKTVEARSCCETFCRKLLDALRT